MLPGTRRAGMLTQLVTPELVGLWAPEGGYVPPSLSLVSSRLRSSQGRAIPALREGAPDQCLGDLPEEGLGPSGAAPHALRDKAPHAEAFAQPCPPSPL